MAPEIGAINPKYEQSVGTRAIRSQGSPAAKIRAVTWGLEAEAGKIAVTNRKPRACDQEAVDGGHQTGEQRVGGSDGDGCSLGHCCPLSRSAAHGRAMI